MSFSVDISKFVGKTKGRENLVVRKICLDLHRSVVFMTPVDTGVARSGWNAGQNNVDYATPKVPENPSSVIHRAKAIIDRVIAGDTIFLTNSVEYIKFLEEGGSKQAPAGMVKTTLRNYPGIVENSVQESKSELP